MSDQVKYKIVLERENGLVVWDWSIYESETGKLGNFLENLSEELPGVIRDDLIEQGA